MKDRADKITSNFASNVEAVRKLMDFDTTLLQICLSMLKSTNEKIKKSKATNLFFLDKAINSLEDIRENDSLKPFYETIYNECIVLLVSYFASALKDLFSACIEECIISGKSDRLKNQEIKFRVNELQSPVFDLTAFTCDSISQSISFQDMQSIRRAFKEYFGCDMEKNNHMNNIILAQACRHSIVHSGAGIDRKLVAQVSNAKPRDLKLQLIEGEVLRFTPDEIQSVAENMTYYLNELQSKVVDTLVSA